MGSHGARGIGRGVASSRTDWLFMGDWLYERCDRSGVTEAGRGNESYRLGQPAALSDLAHCPVRSLRQCWMRCTRQGKRLPSRLKGGQAGMMVARGSYAIANPRDRSAFPPVSVKRHCCRNGQPLSTVTAVQLANLYWVLLRRQLLDQKDHRRIGFHLRLPRKLHRRT